MKNQKKFIIDHLLEHGSISRNYCLSNYISRLGALVSVLKDEGWKLEGKYVKTSRGKDYVYNLVHAPYKKVVYRVPLLDKEFTKYVKI